MLKRWMAARVFAFRVKRAVTRFNTMMPQQRIVVMIQLLRENPELARQFRRALKMEDAPSSTRRVELVSKMPRR